MEKVYVVDLNIKDGLNIGESEIRLLDSGDPNDDMVEKLEENYSIVCTVYGGQPISGHFIAELINNWIDSQESDGNKEEN